jgi:hypothetical protein
MECGKVIEMNKGDYVKYARGAKGSLIGKNGYIETDPDDQKIVMVKFESGQNYPCWVGNLDKNGKIVHCKREKFDVYIGRPSKFGNPFSYKDNTLAIFKVANRDEAVQKYEEWLLSQPELVEAVKAELKNKILGCWCAPLSCHGDVLLKIANS